MNTCLILPNYGAKMINDPCAFPLGFMYLSSFLKGRDDKVKVLNYNLFDYDIKEELKGQDVVALTGYEQFLEENKRIQEIAHEMGILTVLGGALATFQEHEMKRIFDVVIGGEIEECHIDEISWPDYEGFGIEEYNRRHSVKYIGVMASRGCPFNCTFCAQTCKFRERELSLVSGEIYHYIKTYGIEYIVFNDNTLNVRKDRFIALCDMIKKHKVGWSGAIRCDTFDEEMAIAAKDSGCQYFVVGVESFRQDRLDKMNKHLKVDQINKTLDILEKYDINYHGNIILGLDNETVDDITKEIEELPQGYKLFPVLAQPFAGTKVTSSLSADQRDHLNTIFIRYAESRGKYTYEGVA